MELPPGGSLIIKLQHYEPGADVKQILEYSNYAEIKHSNWLKIPTRLQTANQNALFQLF